MLLMLPFLPPLQSSLLLPYIYPSGSLLLSFFHLLWYCYCLWLVLLLLLIYSINSSYAATVVLTNASTSITAATNTSAFNTAAIHILLLLSLFLLILLLLLMLLLLLSLLLLPHFLMLSLFLLILPQLVSLGSSPPDVLSWSCEMVGPATSVSSYQ